MSSIDAVNELLAERPTLSFVLLMTVPAFVYIAVGIADGRSVASVAPSGATIGATFAVVTTVLRRVFE
ncbi:hypothetical protein GRX01_12295 [Halobaculum sp. WSA2]|uniref:Uncharacterized protein n=1 Tax=Halobaculum saliterrae TaxID=2073113 RepID=A0A6B0SX62_9EURY|nr:hypothetical protein [Halobaculum saliterrae]MXR42116.1 hypothetical protein [Halobaculum saliterrae]